MANTINNITIPANTPVNLYAAPAVLAAGITAGDQISVQNLGSVPLKLFSGASAPTGASGYRQCGPGEVWTNQAGDTGAWVTSTQVVQVNVAKVA
jgi:hypothetical protein